MGIDQEVQIAGLKAELEMAHKELSIVHEASKKHRAKYMGLCRRVTEAMMDCEEEPIKKISADRMGEIVEKVRGKR